MSRTILLYDASWNTLGGGEKYVCTMAEVLSRHPDNRVSLLLDAPQVTKRVLRERFGLSLEQVECCTILRFRAGEHLRAADIGITLTNFLPLGNHAKRNICLLQMPYRPMTGRAFVGRAIAEGPREGVKDFLRWRLLHDARKADLVLANSRFTQNNLVKVHRIRAEVLYPPIDDCSGEVPKENIILSVGRFFRGPYNDKRYDILIEAFRDLCRRLPSHSWEYHLVGSCGSDRKSEGYLDYLRALAAHYPVHFHLNVTHIQLREYYQRATIFWHGAGFGVDEQLFPERVEHFGMSTAEAMSAGCIPFAYNAGGQKEVIDSINSGYLWHSIDELVSGTVRIMQNPVGFPSLQRAVREQSLEFSQQRFSERLIKFLG